MLLILTVSLPGLCLSMSDLKCRSWKTQPVGSEGTRWGCWSWGGSSVADALTVYSQFSEGRYGLQGAE